MGKDIKSIEDLTFDDQNANMGDEVGQQRLEDSIRYRGAGRSVLADKNGKLIAGNKTTETAAELGLEILVVKTRGDKLVVVQREDLDLDEDAEARMLAYEDNRIGQMNLKWDVSQLVKDATNGIPLETLFPQDYINSLITASADDLLPDSSEHDDEDKGAMDAKMVKCPCGCEHFFTPDRWYDADEVM